VESHKKYKYNKMKTLRLILVGVLLFFAVSSQAQISVNLSFGNPPQWGPVGYSEARYYYLPDVEAYYDVPSSMFIYFNGVTWVHRSSLPSRYRNYDLYHGYKVVMSDYRGNRPYSNFKDYKVRYAKGYKGQPQKNYSERPDNNSHEKTYIRSTSNRNYNQGKDENYNKDRNEGNKQNNSKNRNSARNKGKDKNN
jgi:hypothetical protein